MTKKKYVLKDDLVLGGKEREFAFAEELNDRQIEAVTTLKGPVLVIAGAGTGKTRTLVYRLAHLASIGVRPANVLLLTFTRRAAEEMLRRAESLVAADAGKAEGGTFHSIAAMLLRKYASLIHYPNNFSILDTADSIELIGRCRTARNIDFKAKRFPRKVTIHKLLSASINRNTPVEFILYDDYPQFIEFSSEIEEIRQEYERLKEERAMMDFDDLLVKLVHLLKNNEEVLQRLRRQYRYIMVDEYQDTNQLQAEIVQLLAGSNGNVMVVGDDSQSIYAFRGANYRNIIDFPKQYQNCKIIKLEENYRSSQQILNVANSTIDKAVEKYTKVLNAHKGSGEKPVVVYAEDENYQSRFIAQKVLEHREEGISLNQQAVLIRASRLSSDLELELSRRNIPYEKRGGLRFFESAHIKDLLAHLKIIANDTDELSWLRALKLIDGIGDITADRVLEEIIDASEPVKTLLGLEKPKTTGFIRFKRLISDLRQASATALPGELLSIAAEYYEPVLEEKYDNSMQRKRDITHLTGIASRYRSLESFVNDISIEPQDRFADVGDEIDPDGEKLTISTIHSAKGLEWRVVYIIWLLDGRFPSSFSIQKDEQLEEERRLFYVSTTRAKDHLYMVYPVNIYDRRTRVMCQPSRFLSELEEQLYEQWNLTEHDPEDDGYDDRMDDDDGDAIH